jgi:adenylate cyclase
MNTPSPSDYLPPLLQQLHTAYILADTDLEILDCGGATWLFCAYMDRTRLDNRDLLEVIPELAGCEEVLAELLLGALPVFELENINRQQDDGTVVYLSLTVLRHVAPDGTSRLLLGLSDTTAATRVHQELTQQHNELRLLKHSLDDTNRRLKFIMQRYVPREVANALMENRILPDLGGEMREVTAMFVDLRNYTGLSERFKPTETIEMVHAFMGTVCAAIVAAGGVIVNYMGDAVMAIFNAPDELPGHALRAVEAGLNMQALPLFYQSQDGVTGYPLVFGVGINTGWAVVGNVGALEHYQYTAIGDTINVASRICSHARAGEVLIGAGTLAELEDQAQIEALVPVLFKGKTQEISVYRVIKLLGE